MDVRAFPFTCRVEVAFRDLDAFGHVNHAVYFTYMETARLKYLQRLFDVRVPADLPIILAHATCAYRSPAFLGETLEIGAGISRIGRKSFDMVYRIEGPDGRLVAEGMTVQVMYDYRTARSRPLPDTFHAHVRAVQGPWRPPGAG
ncbi:MAG: acyl-CoA thioesterase [Ardenticatenia bacterium]|nr:acyl-CoA thioesterase [Ardenticatenia bacterium]